MRDRREKFLKLSCLVLGAILAAQLIRFILLGDPAKGLVIPALPTLPPGADAQTGQTNAPPALAKNGTNSATQLNQTNLAGIIQKTNVGHVASSTNLVGAKDQSNQLASVALTNSPELKGIPTNATSEIAAVARTNSSTNLLTTEKNAETKSLAPTKTGTNSSLVGANSKTNKAPPGPLAMGPMGMGMPMGMPGGKPPEPPAEIKERVDRIVKGEILGQVIRPMPMALLGIAGPNAFLRSSDGQTGMIKEGDKLGSLKLLRIGTNRVLVEEEGEKKELSIFAGLGSESLMPAKEPPAKEKKTNEPTIKAP